MLDKRQPIARDPEAEFLAEQAKLAKRAISHVLGDIGRNLIRSADVRAWAVRYPLPTVATATAAGVGAGAAVRSALHRGKNSAKDAGETPSAESKAVGNHDASPTDQPAKPPGLVASTLRSLATGLAGAAAEALIATTRSQIQAALTPPRDPAMASEPSVSHVG